MTTRRWNHIVRRANLADTRALASLISESVNIKDGSADIAGMPRMDDNDGMARAELLDGDIVTLVAEANEALQGFVQVCWNVRPPSAGWMRGAVELRRHYVRVRHRGAGVAAGLLEAAVDVARAKDATGLWLKVGKDAGQAVAFYQKYGFQIAGSSIAMADTLWRERWVMHRAVRAPARVRPSAFGRTAIFPCGN
ncbi:GNAT family N-acetyltransferase [Thermomonas sp.]|uniref:GNAT family N-acetyltransferase n=1 Tax=Thermomonas sp. TaxID=1971895 RepID=UPI00248A3153|nr:GNAT family N-acetyltransferase [Thermomonas sp.]MDI1252327.1 GNAT family N-acetyltransferase [Thermomonas sp.]